MTAVPLTEAARAREVGQRVLEAFSRGRQKAIEQARERSARRAALILDLAKIDAATGRPMRGLAGRIARKLGGTLSESQVRKILRRLFSVRDSRAYSTSTTIAPGDRA